MPFTDTISLVSGRNSRASNVSGITGVTAASRSNRPPPVPQSDTLASAGVMSMLKTSTDTGDIGALSYNHARLPAMPRAAAYGRRGHHTKLSGSSNHATAFSHHHYAPSQTSRISSSRDWDSTSNQQRRGSLTSMQSMPPSIPPAHLGKAPLQMPLPPHDEVRDSRSFSITSAPAAPPLPRYRSATSLKSQGHEPRHGPPRPGYQGPLPPDSRPPYIYPTRLKRPGYRSPSPALSDSHAQVHVPMPAPPGGRRMPMPRPPLQSYNSDNGSEYVGDPRHLQPRPPPRAMSNSPVMAYGEPQPQYPYRNPAAMRSAPGLSMPMHQHWPQHHHAHQAQQHPSMQRSPYPGALYPARPPHPHYAQAPHPGHRRPSPPGHPHAVPMAHHMFHNAARLARQLPTRTDTPLTGPPSSDPPSSSTAPSSSSPPTPKDQSTMQVSVDPAFIDPALLDLPDSSSQPMLAHQYMRYADGLVKDVEEPEIEAAHPSVPPSGYVQRVRAMLESKAAAEAAAMKESEREKANHQIHPPEPPVELDDGEDMYQEVEIHELAANGSPRFTVIEEFNAPIELPASPVRIAELGASPVQSQRRLTRDLVKAGLAPSVDNTMNTDTSERASIDMLVRHTSKKSRDTAVDIHIVQRKMPDSVETPSTPAGVLAHVQQQESFKDDPETGYSPALGHSMADYAVNFETTTTSDDTRTEDPFVLDADTITLEHQRSKERADRAERQDNERIIHTDHVPAEDETPVSPILSGQDVSRCSAVSPLQTQTLGIDETLQMASGPVLDDETMDDQTEESVTSPDDSQPPPTPRTPKTYSKSVQLQPTTAKNDTPSSNRYSLPPDLSTIGDTTMNSNSEMITDIAVRFSLPQTTITVSRPQIIEIPPSSSPVQEPVEHRQTKSSLQASELKSKRGSVMFADEVAPLTISKAPVTLHKPGDGRATKSKSIIRRPSPLQETIDSSRISRGNTTTTDLRFSGINGINGRFGSTHLPGLKEESVDDMSVSDKRTSNATGELQFPLPARIAAVKAMQERRMQESAEKAKARRALRHTGRPLAEIRDLPSLNFSRMDLIDKLNEALEVRESKSMDIIRRRDFSGIYCPSPQRPMSTEPLRERYTSFFSKPEDFSSFLDDVMMNDESELEENTAAEPDIPLVEVQPSTEIENIESNSRPLSPDELINMATQVNRLSIPSVTALSDRLSDLLPNLRDLQLDSILANFDEGIGGRPDTVFSNRTSAGFRTLAERAEEFVQNGTHDSTVPTRRLLGNDKDLPSLPESMSAGKVPALMSNDTKTPYLSGSVSAPVDLAVARPASALARQKPPMTEDEVRTLLPPEMNPITRHGQRALVMSTASSRPWNQDENYPWNGTKVDMDLTVPSQAHTRMSKSLDLTSTGEPTNTTRGIDIGSIIEHNPTSIITNEQLTGVSSQHTHKQSKLSVIGSITKKIGLASRCDTTRSIASPTVQSGIARSRSSQAHRAGERYPTSSLTPPAAFNLDEVRSFFSDDSSDDKEPNASFRKRLTNLTGKGKTVRIDSGRHSLEGNTTYDAGEMVFDRIGASSAANTYDGVGMGKTEFHIKRFGEKLRHLMAKGGELIRSWSQRSSKPPRNNIERVRGDWLSDSVYSGV